MPAPDYQRVHCHYTTNADNINLISGDPIDAVKTYRHAFLDSGPVVGYQQAPINWPTTSEQIVSRKKTDLDNISPPTTLRPARKLCTTARPIRTKQRYREIHTRNETRPTVGLQSQLSSSLVKPQPLSPKESKCPETVATRKKHDKPKVLIAKYRLLTRDRNTMDRNYRTATKNRIIASRPKREMAERIRMRNVRDQTSSCLGPRHVMNTSRACCTIDEAIVINDVACE